MAQDLSFTVRIEMESDWHTGTGAGRSGHADSVVATDDDGLPHVPAKTLTGIWRDACEQLAWGLDNGIADGPWAAWVTYLFGSQPALAKGPVARPPRPAALSVRPARMAEALRRVLARPEAGWLREAVTFVKPGVSIDEASGQAREKFLRFEEMARAGAVLEAECTLHSEGDRVARDMAMALLVAGAALVERLGGKRRRGGGRCSLSVMGQLDLAGAVTRIEASVVPPGPPAEAAPSTGSDFERVAASGAEWVEIPLVVRLRSPLSIPSRVVGNVGESLDFLPGHHLLPRVRQVLERCGVDAAPSIGRGDVVVLPATIEVDGRQGRPAPFALAVPKGTEAAGVGEIWNLVRLDSGETAPLKPLRTGYVGQMTADGLVTHAVVHRQVRTHNSVDDEPQRPNEETGGVYTYEAIAPGTVLRTALRLKRSLHEAAAEREPRWWHGLAGPCALGRSRKDDYGRVVIEVGEPDVLAPPATGSGEALTRFVVWCLSDVLLRDAALRPAISARALADAIGAALGPGVVLDPVAEATHLRARRLESWQGRWGLPRPSLVGIAAGSCVVLQVKGGPVTRNALLAIARAGIGERTAEGYGQISVDDPVLTQQIAGRQQPRLSPGEVGGRLPGDLLDAKSDAGRHARVIEREGWRLLLRRRAMARAADAGFRARELGWPAGDGRPPATQLNAFRDAVRRVHRWAPDSFAARWLDGVRGVANRAERWPSGALDRASALLRECDRVWDLLLADGDRATLTQDGEARLRGDLWPEAVQALVGESVRQHLRAREARQGSKTSGTSRRDERGNREEGR